MREASCGCSANAHRTTSDNCYLTRELWQEWLPLRPGAIVNNPALNEARTRADTLTPKRAR